MGSGLSLHLRSCRIHIYKRCFPSFWCDPVVGCVVVWPFKSAARVVLGALMVANLESVFWNQVLVMVDLVVWQ